MADTATVEALRKATEGLMYQSETDSPWAAFAWPDMAGEPDPDGVRRRGHHRASAPAEERPLAEFFAPLVQDQDWYGEEEKATAAQYRSLLTAVNTLLTNPKVVRVGKTKVAVYVVGQAKEGGWAGLRTTAVET